MLIIITGIVLVIGGAAGIYIGYGNGDWALAGMGWAALLLGGIGTMFGFGKRMSNRLETPEDANPEAAHTEVRMLIQSMGAVALADTKLRDREVSAIAGVYQEMLGMTISNDKVREILGEFRPDFNIAERLQKTRGEISPAMKSTIVKACHQVMVSDLEVASTETDRVNEIGAALGFSYEEIKELVSLARLS